MWDGYVALGELRQPAPRLRRSLLCADDLPNDAIGLRVDTLCLLVSIAIPAAGSTQTARAGQPGDAAVYWYRISKSRQRPRVRSLLQQSSRLNHSTIVETWKDQQAFEKHRLAAHTRQLHTLIVKGAAQWLKSFACWNPFGSGSRMSEPQEPNLFG